MSKVKKEKQVSNDKEKCSQSLSPIKVWAWNNDLPRLNFWGLAIFGIYRSSLTNIIKKTSIDCNQQNVISRNFPYVSMPRFE